MIALVIAAAAMEPILDGRCDDHAASNSLAEPAGNGVTAYVRQTRDHVWLCFALPQDSFGTLDLRIVAPGLPKPLNLHASAQLGAWVADDPAAAPRSGSSELWWRNIDGWWASVTPFNGMVATEQGGRVNFRPVDGREIQLSKHRFGTGEWKLAATISDVAAPGQQRISVRWPASGEYVVRVD